MATGLSTASLYLDFIRPRIANNTTHSTIAGSFHCVDYVQRLLAVSVCERYWPTDEQLEGSLPVTVLIMAIIDDGGVPWRQRR